MKRADITDEQVIRACILGHQPGADGMSLDYLVQATGAPEKVASAAMERASGRCLIDWGVSLRTAWATPKGKALLTEEGGVA